MSHDHSDQSCCPSSQTQRSLDRNLLLVSRILTPSRLITLTTDQPIVYSLTPVTRLCEMLRLSGCDYRHRSLKIDTVDNAPESRDVQESIEKDRSQGTFTSGNTGRASSNFTCATQGQDNRKIRAAALHLRFESFGAPIEFMSIITSSQKHRTTNSHVPNLSWCFDETDR